MKNFFHWFFGIGICLFFVICLLEFTAVAAVIGSTDDSMTVGGGARPIGMGRAFAAIADDCDAIFINPAGIAGLKGPQLMSMATNLIGDVYYLEFSGAVPTPYGTFGTGYITTGVNAIPTAGQLTDYYDSLLTLSYAVPMAQFFRYGKNLYAGLNYKIYNRGFTGGINQFATGQSADLGLKFIISKNLSVGICRQNILPVSMGGVIHLNSGEDESIAGITKVGIAIKPTVQEKLLLSADADLPAESGRPLTAHMGFEWKENKYFTFRGGLDQSIDPASPSKASWNPALGASLTYFGLRVDYAYHTYYNEPGLATTYVSLSYIGEPLFSLKGAVN